MTSPWDLYDQLTDEVLVDTIVTQILTDDEWRRIASNEDGVGMALDANVQSHSCIIEGPSDLVGCPLCNIVALIRSRNFENASIGMAAANSYHFHPVRALVHGFRPCEGNSWARTFHLYTPLVTGERVAVTDHFPLASAIIPDAAELSIPGRDVLEDDYSGSAREYLPLEMDYVFISGSAFVNKMIPRLLALALDAHTIVLGSPVPALSATLHAGTTTVISFVSAHLTHLEDGLVGCSLLSMYDAGMKVEPCRP